MGRPADRQRRRWPWVVGIVAVVVVVGALVLDPLLAREAEERASAEVGEAMGAPAEVRLGRSFPGLRLLTGRLAEVHITATDVPVEGTAASIDRLDLELIGVRVGLGDLFDPGEEPPEMDEGRFVVRVDQEMVSALVEAPQEVLDLRLIEGGVALVLVGLQFETDAGVVDGQVVFTSRDPLIQWLGGEFVLDLAEQPGSPYVEEVEAGPDAMVLRGRLNDVGGGSTAAG